MHKAGILLIIMGGILAAGLVLSFYAAQWTTENLSRGDDTLSSGESLEITSELDPTTSQMGVFAVNILDFNDGTISAKVFDPVDAQIISKTVGMDRYQDTFEVISKGSHRLVIENSGIEDSQVFGAIGHLPSDNITYLNYAGFYLLIAGLIGMGVVGIYAVKNKRKAKFS
jgi:hypothetical protein